MAKETNKAVEEWLPFAGSVKSFDGDEFLLEGLHGGTIKMSAKDVQVEGPCIAVRNNSHAAVVEKPRASNQVNGIGAMFGGCPCTKCGCIGFVRICCDDGSTRGVCIGVVGC
ncbi:MAG: hypothetical protein H6841_06135 [Planctomycetes bacterium]|nr:hypothetical protein [Planctomycetota bacterium]